MLVLVNTDEHEGEREPTQPITVCLAYDAPDRPAAGEVADRLEPLLESMAKLRIAGLKPRLKPRPAPPPT